MKIVPPPLTTTAVTLQTVLDRVISHPTLPPTRKLDLASAVRCYANLIDQHALVEARVGKLDDVA